MMLADSVHLISCPTLVIDSDAEQFFGGQPKKLYDALKCPKQYRDVKKARDMKIIMTGGTGFVRAYLTKRLISDGHAVTILTQVKYPSIC